MEKQDVRWRQRFSSFKKAFAQLERAVQLADQRKLNELEKQGIIQAFEYTHELAWKTLKDFLEERGNIGLMGSKDVTRLAFKLNLLNDGNTWMGMIKSRNLTSHTYNEDVAEEIIHEIIHHYYNEFVAINIKLDNYANHHEIRFE